MRTTRSKKQRGGVISKAKVNNDLFNAALIQNAGQSLVAVIKALEEGADVNSRHTFHESNGVDTTDDSTALMNASMLDHQGVVILLLTWGADPTLEDEHGWTASAVAGEHGYEELSALLLQPDLYEHYINKAPIRKTKSRRSRRSGGKRKTRKSKKTKKTRIK